MDANFSKSIVGLTNFIFRDSVLQQPTSEFGLMPKTTTQGTGFGGFVGRNWQWDDLVFGVEANYKLFQDAQHGDDRVQFAADRQSARPAAPCEYDHHLHGDADRPIGRAAHGRHPVPRTHGLGYRQLAPLCVRCGGSSAAWYVSRSVTSTVTRRDDTTDPFTGIVTTGPRSPVPRAVADLIEQKVNQFVAGWSAVSASSTAYGAASSCAASGTTRNSSPSRTRSCRPTNLRFGIGYKF